MERNLALEFVRVTEAAALASARWVGKGNAVEADRAARDAVATVMDSIRMIGRVVIGDLDVAALSTERAPSNGDVPDVDIALDCLQSAESVAYGGPNAICAIAASGRGGFFSPPIPYMRKIAVGTDATGCIDVTRSTLDNLVNIADAKRCYVEDLTVCVLARDRNQSLVTEVREAGARIHLIQDGDMAAAIATAVPGSGVDVLMGVGGATEGVLAAAALKCVGGDLQAQVYPARNEDNDALKSSAFGKPDRVLTLDELVGGDNAMFAATGVTDSGVVKGVDFVPGGAVTRSIVMRARSGTVRTIESNHRFDRQPDY
jgi:fructose-1,6-bisphosphatase II